MEILFPVLLALVVFALFAVLIVAIKGLLMGSKRPKRFRRDSTVNTASDSGWIVGGHETSSESESESSLGEGFDGGGSAGGGGSGGDFSGGSDSGGDSGGGDGGGGNGGGGD